MADEAGATNTVTGRAASGTIAPPRPEEQVPDALGVLVDVRPRLRHDVVFAESSDGVFMRHADDGFVLKGKSAYRWVSALSPHLTGDHTVAQLCEGLSQEHRKTVAGLVHTLLDRGFARDHQPADPHDLATAVTARFASQINFVEHYVDRAHERFARFRDSKVVVVGGGQTARAAALGLLRNGLRVVDVHGAGATVSGELADCVAELAGQGVPAEVRVADDLAGYDVVVASTEDTGVAGLSSVVRALSGDTVLIPVTAVAGTAVVGPLSRSAASPCWTCALLRLTANLPTEVTSPMWQQMAIDSPYETDDPTRFHPIAARMIGNALAFDVFRLRTECLPAEGESAVVVVDLDTVTSTREPVVVHPRCPHCGPSALAQAARTQALAVVEQPSERDLSERYWRLVDPNVGVLTGFTDESLDQSPVKAARVRIGLPTGAREITAFDVSNLLAARNRAVRTAAVAYGDALGSGARIRFATAADLAAEGAVATPGSLGTWSGLPVSGDTRLGWLTASSAASGESWFVPAGAVSARFGEAHLFDSPGAGTGAGVDRPAAVEDGVLSALSYRSLRAAAEGAPVGEVTESYPDDPEITMLRHAAGHLDHPIRLYTLPLADCAVSVLATTGDTGAGTPRWLVRTAWTARDAVRDAARDLVGVLQQADGSPVDLGDPIAPDFDPRTVRTGAAEQAGPADARTGWRLRLAGAGLDALVVDTTPPDLVCVDAGLRTVRVLLREIRTGKGGAST